MKTGLALLAAMTSIAACKDNDPTMIQPIEAQGHIDPLPEQAAQRDLYPPEKCPARLRNGLPPGVSLWSCYPNEARFVRSVADSTAPDLLDVDQQIHIHYAVFDNAGGLAAEVRQQAKAATAYADLAPRFGSSLSLADVSRWLIRGQLYENGSIAGSGFFLIDQPGDVFCDIAKPESANPYTVCKIIDGVKVLEVQFPNRLTRDLDELIDQAKTISKVVGGD